MSLKFDEDDTQKNFAIFGAGRFDPSSIVTRNNTRKRFTSIDWVIAKCWCDGPENSGQKRERTRTHIKDQTSRHRGRALKAKIRFIGNQFFYLFILHFSHPLSRSPQQFIDCHSIGREMRHWNSSSKKKAASEHVIITQYIFCSLGAIIDLKEHSPRCTRCRSTISALIMWRRERERKLSQLRNFAQFIVASQSMGKVNAAATGRQVNLLRFIAAPRRHWIDSF